MEWKMVTIILCFTLTTRVMGWTISLSWRWRRRSTEPSLASNSKSSYPAPTESDWTLSHSDSLDWILKRPERSFRIPESSQEHSHTPFWDSLGFSGILQDVVQDVSRELSFIQNWTQGKERRRKKSNTTKQNKNHLRSKRTEWTSWFRRPGRRLSSFRVAFLRHFPAGNQIRSIHFVNESGNVNYSSISHSLLNPSVLSMRRIWSELFYRLAFIKPFIISPIIQLTIQLSYLMQSKNTRFLIKIKAVISFQLLVNSDPVTGMLAADACQLSKRRQNYLQQSSDSNLEYFTDDAIDDRSHSIGWV